MATKKQGKERANAGQGGRDVLVPDYLRNLPFSRRSPDNEDQLQKAALDALEAGDGKLRLRSAKRHQQRDRANERHLLAYGAAPMRQRRQWRVNEAPSLGVAMACLVDFVHQDGGGAGPPDVVAGTLARWIPRFLPELQCGAELESKVLESLRGIPDANAYELIAWPYQAVRRGLIAAGMTVREADDALNAVQQRTRRHDRAVERRLAQFVEESLFTRGGLTAKRWLAFDETTGETRPVSLLSAADAKRLKTLQRVRKHRAKKK